MIRFLIWTWISDKDLCEVETFTGTFHGYQLEKKWWGLKSQKEIVLVNIKDENNVLIRKKIYFPETEELKKRPL